MKEGSYCAVRYPHQARTTWRSLWHRLMFQSNRARHAAAQSGQCGLNVYTVRCLRPNRPTRSSFRIGICRHLHAFNHFSSVCLGELRHADDESSLQPSVRSWHVIYPPAIAVESPPWVSTAARAATDPRFRVVTRACSQPQPIEMSGVAE